MQRIAILGLGAMGSRMARRLLAAGWEVTVWNRNPAAAEALAREGAHLAGTPRAAAQAADVVVSAVYDDKASAAVWLDADTGALAGMRLEAIGVECSTVSPAHVRQLHAAASAQGLSFVDAPVAGSRPQAEAGQLIFMAGGAAAVIERVTPVLGSLGAAVHRVGEAGSGATVKLMVNTLFGAQLATLAELLALAARCGVDPARALEVIGQTPVASPAAKVAGAAMLAGQFAPAAPVDLIAKDLDLAVALGTHAGLELPMAKATGLVYHAASAEGYGAQNITAVVRRYLNDTEQPR